MENMRLLFLPEYFVNGIKSIGLSLEDLVYLNENSLKIFNSKVAKRDIKLINKLNSSLIKYFLNTNNIDTLENELIKKDSGVSIRMLYKYYGDEETPKKGFMSSNTPICYNINLIDDVLIVVFNQNFKDNIFTRFDAFKEDIITEILDLLFKNNRKNNKIVSNLLPIIIK